MPEEITTEQLEMLLQMAVIQQPPYFLAEQDLRLAYFVVLLLVVRCKKNLTPGNKIASLCSH